jgi:hypothetical protein
MKPSAFFLILVALAGCSSADDLATVEEAICDQPGCEDRCVNVCTPFTSCGWPCLRSNGTETTCGQAPAPCGEHTDSDGDGRVNFSDNCPLKSNPDQRDCDGDGKGDVCDTQNAIYGPWSAPSDVCFIDYDLHAGYYTLEFWGEEVSWDTSACQSRPRYRGHRWNSVSCTLFGIPVEQCCFQGEAGIPSHLCPSVNINHCHF